MKQLEPSELVQTLHFKNSLDIALENAVKRSSELLEENEKALKNGEDITGKEFKFRVKEIAKLNNMSALQMRLNEYRAKASSSGIKERALEASKTNPNDNSSILAKNLTASGKFKPNSNWEAHHVICSRHEAHSANRFILFSMRIDPKQPRNIHNVHFTDNMRYGINDPDNGCWLPKKHKHAKGTVHAHAVGHRHIHTNLYAAWVNNLIASSSSIQDLQARLSIIEGKLQRFTVQLSERILTKKGQSDFTSQNRE